MHYYTYLNNKMDKVKEIIVYDLSNSVFRKLNVENTRITAPISKVNFKTDRQEF